MQKLILALLIFLSSNALAFVELDPETLQKAQNGDAQAQYYIGMEHIYERQLDSGAGVTWLLKAAEQNHNEAMMLLGQAYARGIGVEASADEALKWFYRAIALDNPDGYYGIGQMYYIGAVVPRDYDKALEWFTKGVANGSYDCESALERYFKDGEPIYNLNEIIAQAEAGDIDAMYELGKAYYWGRHILRDHKKAAYWLDKAANNGSIDAQRSLATVEGSILRHFLDEETIAQYLSDDKILAWQTKIALSGDSGMLSEMFWSYLFGYTERPRDYAEAMKWLKTGVELEDAALMQQAGELHALGILKPHDNNLAAGLLAKAAFNSETMILTMYILGHMYENGRITAQIAETDKLTLPGQPATPPTDAHSQNYLNAAKWYYMAAVHGYSMACYDLARLYENGLGVTKNTTLANYYYGLAFEKMHDIKYHQQLFAVADMYARGKGVNADVTEALARLQHLFAQNIDIYYGMQLDTYMDTVDRARALAAELEQTASDAEKAAAGWSTAESIFYNQGKPFNYEVTLAKADNGEVNAQIELALRYFEGAGVKPDYDKGLFWLEKAAERGHVESMFILAQTAIFRPNDAEAYTLKWYTKAAMLDYEPAQSRLADAYEYGNGAKRDLVLAYYWQARAYLNRQAEYKNSAALEFIKKEMTYEEYTQARERLHAEGFELPDNL